MSHVAIIVGVSGIERYLRGREESVDQKRAQRFRTERAAERAAISHINAFPPVVQRYMAYRVRPAEAAQAL